jgi:hypothetical protein
LLRDGWEQIPARSYYWPSIVYSVRNVSISDIQRRTLHLRKHIGCRVLPGYRYPAGGLSTGAKAGVGVSVAAIVVLAVVVRLLLFRTRKLKSSKLDQINVSTAAATLEHDIKQSPQMHVHESGGYEVPTLGRTNPAELGTYNMPQELYAPGPGLR